MTPQQLLTRKLVCLSSYVFLVLFFCSVVWPPCQQLLAEAVLLRPITYIRVLRGTITSNNTYQLEAPTLRQCAANCRKDLICSAFTVSQKPAPVTKTIISSLATRLETEVTYAVDCTFAKGDFTWDRTVTETYLYTEDLFQEYPGYMLAADGFFYKGYSNLLNMMESKIACLDEEATLASPYPREQYNHLRYFAPNNSYVWLGLYMWFDLATKAYQFNNWVTDGNDIFSSAEQTRFPGQAWASSEPTNVAFVAQMQPSGSWKVTDKSNLGSRVCRRHKYYRKAPRNGKYYKMHYKHAPSQKAANDVCRSEGGKLAIVRNKTDLTAVRGYWNPFFWADVSGFYVAGTDEAQEGVFVMPDGSKLHAPGLTSDEDEKSVWRTDQPNNVGIGGVAENCLGILSNGQIQDVECEYVMRRFLCEIVP